MSGTQSEAQWPMFRRAARTVVVVDLVESVRLIEQNEEDTVRRWQGFVGEVVTRLLPPHGGRLVKSLGDGLMVEFEAVPPAIQCAIAMQTAISQSNHGRPNDQWMCLRIGAHVADVIVDERDIYGAGVNLAARLTTLAGPGEIVVSADVRDGLTAGLDADLEDLGECYLKHMRSTVRAYRVSTASGGPTAGRAANPPASLLPTIAVIPFTPRTTDPAHAALGDALADDIIAALSQTIAVQVISRLSTAAFRDRSYSLDAVRTHLNAAYVLSGACSVLGDEVKVQVELSDTRDASVVWATSKRALIQDIFHGQDDLVPDVVSNVSAAILSTELRRARALPIPTLNDYTLYVGGVALMHRLSVQDFERSRTVLQHLAERLPRSSAPHAMLAKWHVLQMVQGWGGDPAQHSQLARACANRALDIDPGHAFGLAVDGLVNAHADGDLDQAKRRYLQALDANPQEPLAWALLAGLHSYRAEGLEADAAADKALALSPMDPARFLLESYAAIAKLSAGRFDEAARLAASSVRLNKLHTPSHRILVLALQLAGRRSEARLAALTLMQLEPDFNLREYQRRYPGRDAPHMPSYLQALSAAGIPD